MKLSVIVPVYNVEKFLPRCLESLLRQGMKTGEWEVICINDGSPDNSAAILAEYGQKYPDIFRVITQENKGLGATRNVATAQAQGDYVTYLDSDDYLIDNAYSYLLEHFCQDMPDVLHYLFHNVYTDGTTLADSEAKPDGTITFDGDGAEAFNQWPLHFVWTKFYRRAFLMEHDIWSENVVCQDQLFNLDVFRHHPHLRMVSSNVVRYENGNTSSIQKTTRHEVVLRQLNELVYNMSITKRHLDDGETDLLPAVHRIHSSFLKNYYKKMLNTTLTKKEWNKSTQLLKENDIHREKMVAYETNMAGRVVALLKKMAGHSYVEYRIVLFFHHHIFKRFLFSKIITA